MQDFVDRFDIEGPRSRPGIYLGDTAGLLRVMRLAALCRRDPLPMTAGELARAAILTSGAMTAILDRLEEEGLIRREIDAEDRRARRVTITEKGRNLINRALDQRMAQHRALNAALTLEERETLNALLRKLLIAVEGAAA